MKGGGSHYIRNLFHCMLKSSRIIAKEHQNNGIRRHSIRPETVSGWSRSKARISYGVDDEWVYLRDERTEADERLRARLMEALFILAIMARTSSEERSNGSGISRPPDGSQAPIQTVFSTAEGA